MQVDTYTKVVLTIIAVTLVIQTGKSVPVVGDVAAEVAGMDYRDLSRDYDFKKAVRRVVESDCTADEDGDISC